LRNVQSCALDCRQNIFSPRSKEGKHVWIDCAQTGHADANRERGAKIDSSHTLRPPEHISISTFRRIAEAPAYNDRETAKMLSSSSNAQA
jgi:hypothetical protein